MLEGANYRCSVCGMPHFTAKEAEECSKIPVPLHTLQVGQEVPIPYLQRSGVIIELISQVAVLTHERFVRVRIPNYDDQNLTEETALRFIHSAKRD